LGAENDAHIAGERDFFTGMVVGPALAGDLDIVADETDGFLPRGAFSFGRKMAAGLRRIVST
jgi:hypothetical protein